MSPSTVESTSLFGTFMTAAEVHSGVEFLIAFAIGALACYGFFRFFLRKEIRLYRNLQRPVMIFKSSNQDMEVEKNLLRDSKLFNVPEEPIANYQGADRMDGYGLIIIGYSAGMKDFMRIFDAAKAARIPVIVYSKGMIPNRVFKELRKYSWYSTCQVPLRLINDAFVILSTFPEKNK